MRFQWLQAVLLKWDSKLAQQTVDQLSRKKTNFLNCTFLHFFTFSSYFFVSGSEKKLY